MNINYTLIGSFPVSDAVSDSLPQLIAEYEAARGDESQKMQQISRGILIEMLAAHIYGLDPQDFDRLSDVIDAIRSMDAYVEFS